MNELSELIEGIKDGEKLVLEHGREYFVNADDCFEIVEEGNGGEKRRVGVYLSGKKNVTIDGGGSALKVFGDLTPLLLKGCKNVRIKNLVVDFVCEGCKGRKDGCVCANASAPQTWREEARRCEKYACASVLSCEGVVFENVRLRNFDGTAIYVKNSKNVLLSKIECVLSAAGCACDGFFRFEDCEGKVIADSCTARGCVSHGDFLHVRGKKKCNLVATNNCAGDNAGRGIYYACRGKAKVVGNTFGKTGGAAFCAKDFGVCERGSLGVKKVIFENNVIDGCGNAYEEKCSVAYFPATVGKNLDEATESKQKPVGKISLKNNHFFNPENEEHRVYLSELKKATLKNNSFDRPYKIVRKNVKKFSEKKDVAAEKC